MGSGGIAPAFLTPTLDGITWPLLQGNELLFPELVWTLRRGGTCLAPARNRTPTPRPPSM
jgi:hypothetical protein